MPFRASLPRSATSTTVASIGCPGSMLRKRSTGAFSRCVLMLILRDVPDRMSRILDSNRTGQKRFSEVPVVSMRRGRVRGL